ncbi:monooxygenase 3 [Quercus suber]|uniref:Monooxygenase 3 n=1 Tax=Quercus suber TaxID=58331 RepID=A0AAW0M6A9_QUESU
MDIVLNLCNSLKVVSDLVAALVMIRPCSGNVCVLGDSFHPMTPDIGRGACSALEDGVVLARCLAGALLKKEQSGESTEKVHSESEQYKKIEMGLKNYAKERRWRSIVLISTAYVVGFFQQGDGKLTTFFRDKLLAAFLSSLLLKTFLECSHMHLLLEKVEK